MADTDRHRCDLDENLRYLHATKVASPAGALGEVNVESAGGEPLGHLDGVLIDPAARRVRYYVVEAARRFGERLYLVAADQPTALERDRGVLRLLSRGVDLQECLRFTRQSVRNYSAEDALCAMFSKAS